MKSIETVCRYRMAKLMVQWLLSGRLERSIASKGQENFPLIDSC